MFSSSFCFDCQNVVDPIAELLADSFFSGKMIFFKLSTLMGECRCATGKILPPTPFFHPIRRFLSQDFGPGAQTAGGALSFLPQPYFSSPLDI
jgi:hypothetical protein